MTSIEPTQVNGYEHGRPPGRETKPLDELIIQVIESLPHATRMYPDVYAWKITEAIEESRRG